MQIKEQKIYEVKKVWSKDVMESLPSREKKYFKNDDDYGYEEVRDFRKKIENIKADDEKQPLEFEYVTCKAFKELLNERKHNNENEPNIIGHISISEQGQTASTKKDIVVLKASTEDEEDFSFLLEKTKLSNIQTKGYAYVGDNSYVQIKSPFAFLLYLVPLLLVLLSVLGLMIGLFFYGKKIVDDNTIEPSEELEIEDGTDWDGNMPLNGENSQGDTGFIEIPGYANLIVSTASPNVQLVNPDSNDVYFIYTITEDGNEIYTSKAIEPAKMIDVPLGTMLGAGEHTCTFDISCIDIATQSPCNGGVMQVDILVR